MPYICVLDACVLYPAPVRDLLLHYAREKLYQPKWTVRIHEEWMRSLHKNRPDIDLKKLQGTRELMDETFADAMVMQYEACMLGLSLPDADDIHVLASALKSSATYIVTFNLKDFPKEMLSSHGVSAIHPDEFVARLTVQNPQEALRAFQRQVKFLRHPPLSPEQVLESLRKNHLNESADLLEALI